MSLIANLGKIWLMVEPVDMRRGIDGLSALVERVLQCSPCAGSAFVFCNHAGNRIKVLLWDGSGPCLSKVSRYSSVVLGGFFSDQQWLATCAAERV